MRSNSHTWAVVTATGNSTTLLERNGKLNDAIERARTVALDQRVCAVVDRPYERGSPGPLEKVAPQNIFVEPETRGNAFGILTALLELKRRNIDSTVAFLPADDHHFKDEQQMTRALRSATRFAATNPEFIYLLGVEPDRVDSGLRLIVPRQESHEGPRGVGRFVENPIAAEARQLAAQGALCHVSIFTASVRTLLSMYRASFADLESADFYTDLLGRHTELLKVVRVPRCGSTRLGMPERAAAAVSRINQCLPFGSMLVSSPLRQRS